MASEQEKRKISDLRVVDLRSELELRGMDKTGVKAVLTERLIKVLEEEGHDPEAYVFEPPAKTIVTAKRSQIAKSRSDPDTESESQSNADETHDLSLDVDDEIKANSAGKSEKLSVVNVTPPDPSVDENMEDANDTSLVVDEDVDTSKTEEKSSEEAIPIPSTPVLEEVKQQPTPQAKAEENASPAVAKTPTKIAKPSTTKPAAIKKEAPDVTAEVKTPIKSEIEKVAPDANGVDNEDSINLDIGEDEEKLLADEDDSCISQDKENKDGGDRVEKNQDTNKETTKDEERKTSAADENVKTQEEEKDEKTKSAPAEQKAKDDKDKSKKVGSTSSHHSRNLWVSGLSSATRATDLKIVFSKFGKVVGAKVVTNALTPGARCYGYVTMSTNEEANKCIHYLHRTELHGRMISVERAKDNSNPQKRGDFKPSILDRKRHDRKPPLKIDEKKGQDEAKKESSKPDSTTKVKAGDEKDKPVDGEKDLKEVKEEGAAQEKAGNGDKEKTEKKVPETKEKRRITGPARSRSPHRVRTSPNSRKPRQQIASLLTFAQIRDERARNRLRERERELREEERRRKELIARQREIERRQREEAMRLEKEREKLRLERERIECERIELLRLERERQRLELERQREELHRQQLRSALKAHGPVPTPRFAEARRTTKRPVEDRRDPYPDERKRIATDRRFEQPTPRFEEPRSNDFPGKKDVRRGNDFPPRRSEPAKFERNTFPVPENRPSRRDTAHEIPRRETPHEISRRDHAPPPDVPRTKDNRFERPVAPSFRVRDDRRPDTDQRRVESDNRSKVDPRQSSRDRYPDSAKPGFSSASSSKADSRYMDRTGSTWHSGNTGTTSIKPYSGGSLSSTVMASRDSWSSSERKAEGQSWSRGPAQIQRPVDSGWAMSNAQPMSRSGPGMYPSSSQNLPPSMSSMGVSSGGGGQYSSDRFDSYKPSLGQIRKY